MSSPPLFDVPDPERVPSRWQRPGWPTAIALLIVGLLLGILFVPREVEQVPASERTPAVCVQALDRWSTFKDKTAEYVGATGVALSSFDWSAYQVAAEDFNEWLNRAGPQIDGVDGSCRSKAA